MFRFYIFFPKEGMAVSAWLAASVDLPFNSPRYRFRKTARRGDVFVISWSLSSFASDALALFLFLFTRSRGAPSKRMDVSAKRSATMIIIPTSPVFIDSLDRKRHRAAAHYLRRVKKILKLKMGLFKNRVLAYAFFFTNCVFFILV